MLDLNYCIMLHCHSYDTSTYVYALIFLLYSFIDLSSCAQELSILESISEAIKETYSFANWCVSLF